MHFEYPQNHICYFHSCISQTSFSVLGHGPDKIEIVISRDWVWEGQIAVKQSASHKVSNSTMSELAWAVDYFGLLPLVVLLLSATCLCMYPEYRRISLLPAGQMGLMFFLMRRIQNHHPHHWYLYCPGALVLVSLFLVQVVSRLSRSWARCAFLAVLTAAGVLVTVSTFSKAAGPVADRLGCLVPKHRLYPQVRTDIAELGRLLEYLDRHLQVNPSTVYVLSSSTVLSYSHLNAANLSLQSRFITPPYVVQSAMLDKRDGFPCRLLAARYVVVASPIQYHVQPEDQRSIGIPAQCIPEGKNIGKAFRQLPEIFHLEKDVTVFVFERVRDFSAEQLAEFAALFEEAYPDRPEFARVETVSKVMSNASGSPSGRSVHQ